MTYFMLIPDVGQQISMLHVGKDDQGHGVIVETDPYEGQYIRMMEVLHPHGLVNELRYIYLSRTVLCKTINKIKSSHETTLRQI